MESEHIWCTQMHFSVPSKPIQQLLNTYYQHLYQMVPNLIVKTQHLSILTISLITMASSTNTQDNSWTLYNTSVQLLEKFNWWGGMFT